MIIDKIQSPADLRALDHEQIDELCDEIRDHIIQAVSKTGGHLGSNLGAVELTVALHRVFESPRDVILWDTGHQSYVHKVVTGRRDEFDGLRQRHGLSGYPSRAESPHDWVENSHASTALSYAHGISSGFTGTGQAHREVVAVIGDGSLTGGMAFEALNNLGHSGQPVVIVLNDNGRSYAPTISRLSSAVSKIRSSPNYVRGRRQIADVLDKVPLGGEVKRGLSGAAAAVREMWEPPAFFETLGVRYTGPVDGHDVVAIEAALRDARTYDGPIVVHVITQKGHGYTPAEDDTEKHLHDIGLFDPATGSAPTGGETKAPEFKEAFTAALMKAADKHDEIVAITAAMPGSTGLLSFEEKYPDRFFDVGIAEQHALTAAAGMAMAGLRPVVALYSTFLARAFDQLTYDVGLHELPVILCLDRAGITGPDGASHHGVLDMAMCLRVPGMTVFAPSSYDELGVMFEEAVGLDDGPVALRWSRGSAPSSIDGEVGSGMSGRKVRSGGDVCILSVGCQLHASVEAAEELASQGIEASVWDVRVAPLDRALLRDAAQHPLVATVEDGIKVGGVGSLVSDELSTLPGVELHPRTINIGTPVSYLPHGDPEALKCELGLDGHGIAATIFKALGAR
ncbi:MAG: 1-deoxy-D-xylulose-5-phosphate synthase [Actinomycetia bacterium]|nr:1-deoxy-D-xylulose-5-phosphate synthase [Actinomycetes bacterium]MCP4960964.1 1-deoxy-D-xylulose-5-phosphate synthase [Actinomycetes bacterium]